MSRSFVQSPRRGDVFLVNFDPTLGAEIKKTRPALILQNDIANRHSPITIVAAITSSFEEPLYPTEVLVRAREGGFRPTPWCCSISFARWIASDSCVGWVG